MYAAHGSSVEVDQQSRTSVQNNAVDNMLLGIPRKIYPFFRNDFRFDITVDGFKLILGNIICTTSCLH